MPARQTPRAPHGGPQEIYSFESPFLEEKARRDLHDARSVRAGALNKPEMRVADDRIVRTPAALVKRVLRLQPQLEVLGLAAYWELLHHRKIGLRVAGIADVVEYRR